MSNEKQITRIFTVTLLEADYQEVLGTFQTSLLQAEKLQHLPAAKRAIPVFRRIIDSLLDPEIEEFEVSL